MTERGSARLILAGLFVVFCLLSFTTWKILQVGSSMERSFEYMARMTEPMQTITENVTRPDGSVVIIATTRIQGESVEDWGQRHQEAVDYWRSH